MADRRKLQGEIDRCLKKVSEGVETFEDIWQKVHNATNTNQKEKYEADLKKEIKKLQRLRDQIKTWCASSEIKDKRLLVENRKLIETQMERFKVVERETKTKAYSKEGLGAAQKLDPAQKEKEEINNWLSTSIDTLNLQVEQFESEIEASQIVQRKSKKDRDKIERADFLKKRLEKHRYHIKQLETLMRMLDNETVEVDQIKKIKEDIEYYIESSLESDFQDNDFIYDDLDLEDMIAFVANNVVDSTNAVLTKSSSTTSATKSETNNSSTAGSVENEDINAQSNSSSANDSPAPSPSLINSHSNKSTANSSTNEFAFITVNSSPTITTITTVSSNKTVWSSSTTPSRSSAITANPTSSSVDPIANSPPKSIQEVPANDTRSQANSSNSSAQEASNHLISSTATVTLYSAAAAAATSSVTSTASVSNNPWNTTIASTNSTELNNHQILGSRQVFNNGSQIQLSTQQQMLMQQQSNNHLLNGFKTLSSVENPNISSLKSLAQQTIGSAGLDEHLMNSLSMNLSNMNLSNSSASSNPLNQLSHLNELSTSGQSSNNQTNDMHVDHSNLFKNNLLIHQPNSQIMQESAPASSASPPSNINSVSSVPTNSNNISNVDTSLNVPSSVNSTSQQNQSQVFYQPFSNQTSKTISKQVLFQMHLLESAFRYPIIPLDSYRLKPITKMSPPLTAPVTNAGFPNKFLPQFDNLEFYQRLANETLFFIFYYMEGTKAQYMAAKTLKNQSWRFHTKFMMWFQRLEEPKVITEDYEQGTYIYFDYERWVQRKRDGFIFEYKFLEDKDLN